MKPTYHVIPRLTDEETARLCWRREPLATTRIWAVVLAHSTIHAKRLLMDGVTEKLGCGVVEKP